jgi:predicted nucleic acid-binding protein
MWLLDGNILVALVIDTHVFHERVSRWFDSLSEPFATCAITEAYS